MQEIKINFGCGPEHKEGYLNVDADNKLKPNIVCDVTDRERIKEVFHLGKAKEVYHSHLLEHLEPFQAKKFLEDCYNLLMPGGELVMEIPLIDLAAKSFVEGRMNEEFMAQIFYGDRTSKFQTHKWGYTINTANKLLEDAGFKEIRVEKLIWRAVFRTTKK